MKRKILIITPFLIQGGVEHSLITALSQIDYKKNDVTLYLYKNGTDLLPQVPEEVRVIQGVDETHYYRKPLSLFFFGLSKLMKVLHIKKAEYKLLNKLYSYIHICKVYYPKRKILNDYSFDIVISYCLHLGTEIALTLNAEKHYLFLHNSHIDYHQDIFDKCKSGINSFFAVSKGVKDVYLSTYSELSEKMYVINNYVDAPEVIAKSNEYSIKKTRSDNQRVLCTCGRLATEKGFDLAVKTAAMLKNLGYSFYWFFVGDGYLRRNIENTIYKNGLEDYIEITGFKENPYPYIAFSDIYVQPSYEESQGLAIYEALVLGKAVVSTDTIGGRCTLDFGNKGIITDISAEALADGIKKLIDNEELLCSYENRITLEDNLREKQIYFEKWKKLLDGEY